MHIEPFFDQQTATFSYIVSDVKTQQCAIIDPVLDFDFSTGKISTQSADQLIAYVKEKGLSVQWILETHVHADHLTAATYLKSRLGGKIAIGDQVKEVINFWSTRFNDGDKKLLNGDYFDHFFKDGDTFSIGQLSASVMHTPGHTPACATYLIQNAAFVGDTIFMPDVGTARADFPGGSAKQLYASIQKIYALPEDTQLYLCHDYPGADRKEQYKIELTEQKAKNVMLPADCTEAEYMQARSQKDAQLPAPRLLLPSLQMNIRAGTPPVRESNGQAYIKIPLEFETTFGE